MDKQEALRRWIGLEPDQQIMPHFTPIAADARGSTFGACGIRLSGNPAFIDAVLSRLKDLLEAESGSTRLVLSRQPVKPVTIDKGGKQSVNKHWDNAADDAEVCYIQIRERTGRTRHRKALERTAELPKSDAVAKVKAEPKTEIEPTKVAHIGTRNGEVLWDDEDGEEAS